MSNRDIQRQRMKGYFIAAAKEIIEEKGLEEVTVRSVARIAGYSYATIYNYFNDLNELLWYVFLEYVDEVSEYLDSIYLKIKNNDGKTILKKLYNVYVKYFLEKPTVYRFIFFSQLGEPPEEILNKINPSFTDMQRKILFQCVKEGIISEDNVEVIGDILSNLIHGLLSLLFANKKQLTRNELLDKINQEIDFLIK